MQQELTQEVLDECKVVHTTWNALTKVWTLPVIHNLGLKEPARFNELKRRTEGISATSLTERLSELEREGIVQRKVYPDSPPRVEYALTKKGWELHEILAELSKWAVRWGKAQAQGARAVAPPKPTQAGRTAAVISSPPRTPFVDEKQKSSK